MPITPNSPTPGIHANLSSDAISARHGAHQLAHTLMMRGIPLNSESCFEGPFNPCMNASGNVSPIDTSPFVSANAVAKALSANNMTHRIGSRLIAKILAQVLIKGKGKDTDRHRRKALRGGAG